MRQRQEYGHTAARTNGSLEGDPNNVHLFGDYVIVSGKECHLVRVLRMRHKGKDYRLPVNRCDSNANDIHVTVGLYKCDCDHVSLTTELKTVSLCHFRFPIKLFSDCDGRLKVSPADHERLTTPCTQISRPARAARQPAAHRTGRRTQYQEDDGRRCVVTDAAPSVGDVRRSTRRRTLIIHEFQ